jgi:hypothetical protein
VLLHIGYKYPSVPTAHAFIWRNDTTTCTFCETHPIW